MHAAIATQTQTESNDYAARLEEAAREYVARQDRKEHPGGSFDKAGRWYPSKKERCECCDYIRTPSRAWPNSLIKHCRSVEHVANLYDVGVKDLRRAARAVRTAAEKGGAE